MAQPQMLHVDLGAEGLRAFRPVDTAFARVPTRLDDVLFEPFFYRSNNIETAADPLNAAVFLVLHLRDVVSRPTAPGLGPDDPVGWLAARLAAVWEDAATAFATTQLGLVMPQPAIYGHRVRQVLTDAAYRAGFRTVDLPDETVPAVRHWDAAHPLPADQVLYVHIGAGTTVLAHFVRDAATGQLQARAQQGSPRLSGLAFDLGVLYLVLEALRSELGMASAWDLRHAVGPELWRACRAAREQAGRGATEIWIPLDAVRTPSLSFPPGTLRTLSAEHVFRFLDPSCERIRALIATLEIPPGPPPHVLLAGGVALHAPLIVDRILGPHLANAPRTYLPPAVFTEVATAFAATREEHLRAAVAEDPGPRRPRVDAYSPAVPTPPSQTAPRSPAPPPAAPPPPVSPGAPSETLGRWEGLFRGPLQEAERAFERSPREATKGLVETAAGILRLAQKVVEATPSGRDAAGAETAQERRRARQEAFVLGVLEDLLGAVGRGSTLDPLYQGLLLVAQLAATEADHAAFAAVAGVARARIDDPSLPKATRVTLQTAFLGAEAHLLLNLFRMGCAESKGPDGRVEKRQLCESARVRLLQAREALDDLQALHEAQGVELSDRMLRLEAEVRQAEAMCHAHPGAGGRLPRQGKARQLQRFWRS